MTTSFDVCGRVVVVVERKRCHSLGCFRDSIRWVACRKFLFLQSAAKDSLCGYHVDSVMVNGERESLFNLSF